MDMQTCPRCNGKGKLPHYSHVMGGQCFKCKGECEIPVKAPAVKRGVAVIVGQLDWADFELAA